MSAPQALQAPAVKPLPSNTLRHANTSSKHHGPIRAAASAYVPARASTTVGLSEAYVGARLAAFAASSQIQRQAQSPTSARPRNGSIDVSPNRGRQLHPKANVASGAARSAASPTSTNPSPKPAPRSQLSPAAAAKHASAHHSPQRSPAFSPQRTGKSASPIRGGEKAISHTNALPGAVASMSSSPTRVHPESAHSVRSRVLDLEKIPVLLASEGSQTSRDTYKPQITSPREERGKPLFSGYSVSVQSSPTASRRSSTQSTSRTYTLPTELSRHSSQDSTSNPDKIMGRAEFRSAVTRSPGPRPRLMVSTTHSTLRSREDYRNGMTVNALADAMVASSLASSRAVSPAKRKKPPPLPAPRRSRSFTALSEIKAAAEKEDSSRHARHQRPMKHTLRKHGTSDDEGVELIKRGRRHWMRKHPNKHSEGDRQRWRDKVTESERKRYEGVFAANRGLHIGLGRFVPSPSTILDSAEGNQVVNIVVRDVWERSRLPRDVLRDIYELVVPDGSHALNREQFVVGMWLIDQRLKGRKLPVKVSADVWSSVRHTQGIKIKGMH